MRLLLRLWIALLLLTAACSQKADFLAAMDQRSTDQIRALLKSGANPNQLDGLNRPALILAIMKKRPEVVDLLLDSGANAKSEYEGVPAIMFATAQPPCSAQIVGSLLKRGAEPNVRENHSGATPLMQAAASGAERCVELLLKAGARVNVENSIRANSVWVAAEGGNPAVLQRFLAMDVDPNQSSVQNVTPLMVAAAAGNTQIVEILLQHRVNACVVDIRGRSARDMALEKGYRALSELLPVCPGN
jgi:ankyrin repeat protein